MFCATFATISMYQSPLVRTPAAALWPGVAPLRPREDGAGARRGSAAATGLVQCQQCGQRAALGPEGYCSLLHKIFTKIAKHDAMHHTTHLVWQPW